MLFCSIFNKPSIIRNIFDLLDDDKFSKDTENDKSAEILLNEAIEAIKAVGGACDVTIAEDFMELVVERQKPSIML